MEVCSSEYLFNLPPHTLTLHHQHPSTLYQVLQEVKGKEEKEEEEEQEGGGGGGTGGGGGGGGGTGGTGGGGRRGGGGGGGVGQRAGR